MNRRNSSNRAVTTRKMIDRDQFRPPDGLRPRKLNSWCQRSSTHDTAVYKKSSTQLLLGCPAGWPVMCARHGFLLANEWLHWVVPPGVKRVAAQQPAHG